MRGIETPGRELTLEEWADKNDVHYVLVNEIIVTLHTAYMISCQLEVYHMPNQKLEILIIFMFLNEQGFFTGQIT